ncbi:hypothetical protein MAR_005337 [Mya arenaria]|uniref:Uncharacterized protein n=1 Tax=Mya arenaria TaxID=6604 RepID=A0ABY7EZ87_MYAAR|nr:hypothetical protein MAR_005329 [Mya arenaria]WAR15232.1 hypothetical protein MAR_005337 [Mya arenaria]
METRGNGISKSGTGKMRGEGGRGSVCFLNRDVLVHNADDLTMYSREMKGSLMATTVTWSADCSRAALAKFEKT